MGVFLIYFSNISIFISFVIMSTNREVVSRVINGGRFVTKDGSIRWRYILSIARMKAKFLMSQKLDELSLNKEEGIKFRIECFPMERIQSKDCGIVEFKLCDRVMRSCNKLPETIFGKSGTGILRVTNIDESKEYKYVTAKEYARLKKRKYRNTSARYFTIKDERLICPESNAELLEIEMIAIDRDDAEQTSSCAPKDSGCRNVWDADFVCPDRFLELVVQDTISEVANFYRTSMPDENPNLDEHQKTQTTT